MYKNSDYFLEETFNKRCDSLDINPRNFSVPHMNIKSVHRHIAELECYLSCLQHEFSVLALTETWFKDSTIDTYSLDSYSHVF